MLSWSINLFRVRGIQLALHWSFILLLCYESYQGYRDDGLPGLAWSAGALSALFTCVVLHELGHSLTARRFGVRVRRILLMPIGGMAEFDSIPREPKAELLITAAGPLVNFVIVLILLPVVGLAGFNSNGSVDSLRHAAEYLMTANLVLGVFNLLPIFPMDGGRILRALLSIRFTYLKATYLASIIGKVLAIIAILLAFFVFHEDLVTALFVFILFAGDNEYRAVKRREESDAQWRAMIARLHAVREGAGEPPLL
jgi:Zn-dependent protease